MPPEIAPESTDRILPTPPLTTGKEDKKEAIGKSSAANKPSSVSPSALLQQFKPVDDDDQIDFILLQVQAEQSRVNEKLTQLQQYSHDLIQLKSVKNMIF